MIRRLPTEGFLFARAWLAGQTPPASPRLSWDYHGAPPRGRLGPFRCRRGKLGRMLCVGATTPGRERACLDELTPWIFRVEWSLFPAGLDDFSYRRQHVLTCLRKPKIRSLSAAYCSVKGG